MDRRAGADDTDEADTDGEATDDGDGLTYAEAGVDVEASEAATGALIEAAGEAIDVEYAGLLPFEDHYLGVATDGVGTKLLVAEALSDYSTIGIDCIAMNVNDLVAAGVDPLGFVDYLAVEEPREGTAEAIGEGLAVGAERAGVSLLGGETAVMPEVIRGLDLAGTAVGIAPTDAVFEETPRAGDRLVGFPSAGIHSNGLTLAREAVTREYEYDDPFPPEPERSIGEVLLEPTRIYAHLLGPMRSTGVRSAAHVTGGGWTNLERLGDRRYVVDDPFDPQPVFEFVQELGSVTDREMHRTFNVGTGFVAAVPADAADALVAETDGRVIGRVEDGDGVAVRGLEL
jgi:phosphoribosylformylglycinamidine cyclo-ligase